MPPCPRPPGGAAPAGMIEGLYPWAPAPEAPPAGHGAVLRPEWQVAVEAQQPGAHWGVGVELWCATTYKKSARRPWRWSAGTGCTRASRPVSRW